MTTQSPDATEQVERVARALVPMLCGSQEDQYGNDLPDVQFDDLTPDWQERHREYARAAIEAAALPSNATTNECPECQGRGEVWVQAAGLPRAPNPVQCDYCHGTGTMAPSDGEAPPFDDATTNASLVEALDEDALIVLLMNELHSHVPEDQRPMSMSDLSDEQAARARKAVNAVVVAALLSKPAGRHANMAALEATLRASNPDEEGKS